MKVAKGRLAMESPILSRKDTYKGTKWRDIQYKGCTFTPNILQLCTQCQHKRRGYIFTYYTNLSMICPEFTLASTSWQAKYMIIGVMAAINVLNMHQFTSHTILTGCQMHVPIPLTASILKVRLIKDMRLTNCIQRGLSPFYYSRMAHQLMNMATQITSCTSSLIDIFLGPQQDIGHSACVIPLSQNSCALNSCQSLSAGGT